MFSPADCGPQLIEEEVNDVRDLSRAVTPPIPPPQSFGRVARCRVDEAFVISILPCLW